MDIIDAVLDMLFTKPVVVFAISTAFIGLVVVLLDWLLSIVTGRSLLKLAYRGRYTLVLFAVWGIGAGLAGYLGASFQIFQNNIQSCILVGTGWPSVLPRLLKLATQQIEREDFEDES